MPESIERRKRQAVLSALVNGCWLVLSAGVVLWLRQLFRPQGILSVLLAVAAGADILMLLPLAVSLRQRLKEIEGGEEDEACQY
ncbi:hypothetical protein [Dysosmobacter sp.]|uniref:hypothetical protein n=1 Tax=Dysosmobacter sp. TaxID=2591382 RepID=UPI002A8A0F27|nr:hypothetical protein [Dysosmobacter sp.]MDY3984071.1 hypothetical protein [Dysosmobacter sp.]